MRRRLIKLLRSCDGLFGRIIALCLPAVSRAQPHPRSPRSIIVIKLWAIGESVLTLPALKALRQQYPYASLTIFTTKYVAPVYRHQPGVQVVQGNFFTLAWYVAQKRHRFDIAVDFEPYLYGSAMLARWLGIYRIGFDTRRRGRHYSQAVPYHDQQHVAQTYADLLQPLIGHQQVTDLLPLVISHADQSRMKALLLEKKINTPFVCIAPSVGRCAKLRQWPIERFASVADELAKQGFPIVWIGAAEDHKLITQGQALMQYKSIAVTTLQVPQVAELLRHAALVIANDSGLMHVGAAMGTATLGLFGPNLPQRFRPLNAISRFLFHASPCSPHINVHRGEISEQHCTCIRQISTVEVLFSCRDMLKT